jgi:hypothetical protein
LQEIVDLRNVYRPEEMKKHGFAYICVGRAPSHRPVNVYIPPARPDLATAAPSVAVAAGRVP